MENSKIEWRSYIKIAKLKGKFLNQIYTDLITVFGKNCPGYSVVRWFHKFENNTASVCDAPRIGRSKTGRSERHMQRVQKMIEELRQVKYQRSWKLSYGTAYHIITSILVLVIRCARWVPKILTKDQIKMRRTACEENIRLNNLDSEFVPWLAQQ